MHLFPIELGDFEFSDPSNVVRADVCGQLCSYYRLSSSFFPSDDNIMVFVACTNLFIYKLAYNRTIFTKNGE